MGIPDHLNCLLRNLYTGQEELELDIEQQTGSKSGKEYVKAIYCHPAYLTYIQSTSCEMPGWMKHKLESRLPGEISITLDTQMTPPLWQSKEGQRSLLMKVKGEWKSWLKTQHSKNKDHGNQSHHFMANRYGNTQRIYFLGLQNHCRWWLQPWNFYKRRLLLGKKAITNLDSILKIRGITLPTKVHLVKAIVFPVVMYGCEI